MADDAAEGPWTRYQPTPTGPWSRYAPQGDRRKAAQPVSPTEGMSATERFLAGAGKAFVDTARGAGQLITKAGAGLAAAEGGATLEESRQAEAEQQAAIDESRRLDKPLMATTAGKVGNIAGNVAATLPAAAIPGVNTYAGAAALGGAVGALQPTATGESRTGNVLAGAASGVAGKALGDVAATGLGYIADKLGRIRPAPAATEAGKLMEQGYKLPPSYAKVAGAKPGKIAEWAEGFGGKIKTEQAFSKANQVNTNRLVRQGLGLAEGDKVQLSELEDLRQAAGETYEAVKQFKGQFTSTTKFDKALDAIEGSAIKVSKPGRAGLLRSDQVKQMVDSLRGDYSPEEAVEILKKLRADGSANIRSLDAPTKALGRAQRQAASALEGLMDEHLSAAPGTKGLYKAFTQAREVIAKSYDVEKALNETTGNVSAIKLSKLLGKRPLSGEIKDVARFGKGYEGIAREIEQRGSREGPSLSPLDYAVAALHPKTGALMLARPAARAALKTGAAQRAMLPASAPTLEQFYAPVAGEVIGAQVPSTYGR